MLTLMPKITKQQGIGLDNDNSSHICDEDAEDKRRRGSQSGVTQLSMTVADDAGRVVIHQYSYNVQAVVGRLRCTASSYLTTRFAWRQPVNSKHQISLKRLNKTKQANLQCVAQQLKN